MLFNKPPFRRTHPFSKCVFNRSPRLENEALHYQLKHMIYILPCFLSMPRDLRTTVILTAVAMVHMHETIRARVRIWLLPKEVWIICIML